MTWLEFKTMVEQAGVRDGDRLQKRRIFCPFYCPDDEKYSDHGVICTPAQVVHIEMDVIIELEGMLEDEPKHAVPLEQQP